MIRVGNVGVGQMFLYNGAVFVVMPFNCDDRKYYNLCIATRNYDYGLGDQIWLDEMVEVQYISTSMVRDFIPKDWEVK